MFKKSGDIIFFARVRLFTFFSFYPTESENVLKCVIHPGRKDKKKGKGPAFELLVGTGDKPGEEYAALAVLHQIEHGKPLERLLAPEFRETWLHLDERHKQIQENMERKAANREKRELINEKREERETNRVSATITISAASRQLIEDALLHQKAKLPQFSQEHGIGGAQAHNDEQAQNHVLKELLRMGFSKLDATDASQLFNETSPALDYLCLNLDESELPPSFAPASDVEVVQLFTPSSTRGPGFIDPVITNELTHLTCMSKLSTSRAMKHANGDFRIALASLYDILTHNTFAMCTPYSLDNNVTLLAKTERETEEESIRAIYDSDVTIGVGSFSRLSSSWAAVITLQDGIPGIEHSAPVQIVFIDHTGNYPFTAPIVLISSSFDNSSQGQRKILSAAQRRFLVRATIGEICTMHLSYRMGAPLRPIPVIYHILSFLGDATEGQLLDSARRLKSSDAVVVHSPHQSRPGNLSNVKLIPKNVRSSRLTEKPHRVLNHVESPELSKMLSHRKKLPAHESRKSILLSIQKSQVVVICGATGSGKTTQVPQFILEEASEKRTPVSVVCTQPRRIAAISVAERVAAERCEEIGGNVGYQVKLKSRKSTVTRLLFCTTGILLRQLQNDSKLDAYTHVVIDEVHERSVETDLLLLLLREILSQRSSLRVVLMSATLDAGKFASYFACTGKGLKSSVPVVSISGRTFPVDHFYLTEAIAYCGYRLKPGDRFSKKRGIKDKEISKKYDPEPHGVSFPINRNSASLAAAEDDPEISDYSDNEVDSDEMSSCSVTHVAPLSPSDPHSLEVKNTVSLIDEKQVNVDLIETLVTRIDEEGRQKNEFGAILIFLPGVTEISEVLQRLSSCPGASKFHALPLHSLLSPEEQSRVFIRISNGKRKIICSTNIAETSITVEDVTVVIDTLRVKQMGYDSLNGCSVLEEQFVSKAEAEQRSGRAGRVAKGTCYRLVRRGFFDERLAVRPTPEIQRVALEPVVLNVLSIMSDVKASGDPAAFLSKAVDAPNIESISKAITNLVDIGALERRSSLKQTAVETVELTALGRHLSLLPVDARIGKLLIYGTIFGCVDAMLTIAATISERSPFILPFDKRDEAREAKEAFSWGKSDLLLFLKAFNAWREVRDSNSGISAENSFCIKNFLSRKTLIAIEDGRKQLADSIADAGFCASIGKDWERSQTLNQHGMNVRVLRAVICAALYPNLVRIDFPKTKYEQVAGGTIAKKHNSKDIRFRCKTMERLFLHPGSINFFEGGYDTRWLAYFTKVKTSKIFIRDSTLVSPYAILLFGGNIEVNHEKEEMSVDEWIVFKSQARVAVMARELRRELDALLLRKFSDSTMDLAAEGRAIIDAMILFITQEGR